MISTTYDAKVGYILYTFYIVDTHLVELLEELRIDVVFVVFDNVNLSGFNC